MTESSRQFMQIGVAGKSDHELKYFQTGTRKYILNQ